MTVTLVGKRRRLHIWLHACGAFVLVGIVPTFELWRRNGVVFPTVLWATLLVALVLCTPFLWELWDLSRWEAARLRIEPVIEQQMAWRGRDDIILHYGYGCLHYLAPDERARGALEVFVHVRGDVWAGWCEFPRIFRLRPLSSKEILAAPRYDLLGEVEKRGGAVLRWRLPSRWWQVGDRVRLRGPTLAETIAHAAEQLRECGVLSPTGLVTLDALTDVPPPLRL